MSFFDMLKFSYTTDNTGNSKGNKSVAKSNTSTKKGAVPINKELQTVIAPSSIEYERDYAVYGDANYVTTLVISRYPPEVKAGWLAKIAGIDNVAVSVHIEPTSANVLMAKIEKNLGNIRFQIDNAKQKQQATKIESQKRYDDGVKILEQIAVSQESVYYVVVLVQVSGRSKEDMEVNVERVKARLAGMGIKAQTFPYKQPESIQAMLPLADPPKEIKLYAKRNMPSSTVAAMAPWDMCSLNDQKGMVIGLDEYNNLILLDIFAKTPTRPSSNMIVVGTMGSGKTTTVQSIMLNQIAQGTKIIAFDPNAEYGDIAKYFGGDVIDATDARVGMINPLQIFQLRDDDKNAKMPLAAHMDTVEIFLKYMTDFSVYELKMVEEELERVYADYGITYETTSDEIAKLQNTDYPIFEDLYKRIVNRYETADSHNKKEWDRIKTMIRSIAVGRDSQIFNGYTTLSANSDLCVIDTSRLNNATDNLKKAQYFLLLSWAWDQASKDKVDQKIIICDEAHLLINKDLPQTAATLKSICKMARKFECGIFLISQELNDFLHPAVSEYGEGIVANAVYKLIMRSEPHIVDGLSKLFRLTEAEQAVIQSAQKGNGLLLAGDTRMRFRVELEPWELEIMGSGRGR